MSEPVFEITKAAQFDAAHSLPHGPKAEYRRLHGHSFQVEATLRGVMDAGQGWVEDLGALDLALKGLAGALDHGRLNDTPGLETPDAGAPVPALRRTASAGLPDPFARRRISADGAGTLRAGAVGRAQRPPPLATLTPVPATRGCSSSLAWSRSLDVPRPWATRA